MGAIDMIDFFKSMFTSTLGRLFLAFAAGVLIVGVVTWVRHKDDPYPLDEPRIEFDDALAATEWCYETETGNDVFRGTADCPAKEFIDKVESDFMVRFGAMPKEIQHRGVVFVSELIDCVKCNVCQSRAWGCTNGIDIVVTARNESNTTWAYMSELGHVVSVYRYGDLDRDHKRPLYP